MARKVQYLLIDDIDGGTAEETVSFALDGVNYEVDLSKKNAEELRNALAPYIGASRKVGGRRGRGRARGGARADTQAIREWARAQGLKISDRGRIPSDIIEKYEAAVR